MIKARRKRVRERLAAGAVLGVCLSLAVCAFALSGANPGAGPKAAATAQIPLMLPDVGGYVLTGVICFALGIAITLFYLRKTKSKMQENNNLNDDEGNNQ